jgi:hypothetical protein
VRVAVGENRTVVRRIAVAGVDSAVRAVLCLLAQTALCLLGRTGRVARAALRFLRRAALVVLTVAGLAVRGCFLPESVRGFVVRAGG